MPANSGRIKHRRGDLPDPPTFSKFELESLIAIGAEAAELRWATEQGGGPYHPPPLEKETLEEKQERERREAEEDAKFLQERADAIERRKQLSVEFGEALNSALAAAYNEGGNMAVRQAERTAWNARSVALYLLVFAVVLMPVIAILSGVTPQDFGSYVAPITGIAGTVVGYWFSRSGGAG
ncbi:hypothetical protein [Geodermatophilus sp. SYSU D00710]